jgi:hypothetical protein
MSGVFYVIARVYVMMFEVCQQCFVLLFRVYVMRTITQITADIPQTSLHQHGTPQNTPDIPQTSLHKHGTITQITPEIPQTYCPAFM